MAEIPSGWESVPVGSFLAESREPGTNGAEAKKLTVKLYGRGVIPKAERQPGSAKTKYYTRRAGQFIYSKLDFLNGAFAIIPSELDGRETTLDLPAFDFVAEVDRRWFLYFVSRPNFYENKRGLSRGSRKARRVPPKDFLGIELPTPPLPEQKKIAEILGSVDEAIQATQAVIDQTRKVKQGLLKQLLTRGIGHTRFKQTEIGEIPESWEAVGLGDLVSFKTGKLDSNRAVADGRYPFFTCSQTTLRIDQFSFDTEAILLAGNNAQGIYPVKHYRGRFDAYQRTYVIETLPAAKLSYRFLYHSIAFALERLRALSTGTSTKFLTMKVLKPLPIALPPLVEQTRIADVLDGQAAAIEDNESVLDRLRATKSGLMSDLLSGRVRVQVDA